MASRPLRKLQRRLVWVLVVYLLGGTISQKLVPGVDEIFPFFGWSLFSRIPALDSRYELVIHSHNRNRFEPAETFLLAPPRVVSGDRNIGRKLIQSLGEAREDGDAEEFERLRALLESNYLLGRVEYELVFESYDPLVKWRTGEVTERRSLATLRTERRQR